MACPYFGKLPFLLQRHPYCQTAIACGFGFLCAAHSLISRFQDVEAQLVCMYLRDTMIEDEMCSHTRLINVDFLEVVNRKHQSPAKCCKDGTLNGCTLASTLIIYLLLFWTDIDSNYNSNRHIRLTVIIGMIVITLIRIEVIIKTMTITTKILPTSFRLTLTHSDLCQHAALSDIASWSWQAHNSRTVPDGCCHTILPIPNLIQAN